MSAVRYAALLRGINVGGHKKVPMAELRKSLEDAGFRNVKTLLASGNVLFDTAKTPEAKLAKKIEELLESSFGFEVGVIVRSVADLHGLVQSTPFRGIKVTAETRLYVTFLSEKFTSSLQVPYTSPDKSYRILSVGPREVISVLTVTAKVGTTDAMKILEKEFGKKITTRNWNTVQKLVG
jgi:uncharacterized protein (DUF1697 family)